MPFALLVPFHSSTKKFQEEKEREIKQQQNKKKENSGKRNRAIQEIHEFKSLKKTMVG